MNKMTPRLFAFAGAAALCALLAGCGNSVTTTAAVSHGVPLKGNVHGGQQPVKNTVIQLYAASTSGYGQAATALIASTVKTDSTGSFNITGSYTCPSPSAEMYITATGGDPGVGSENANLAMMAALGPCSTLTPSRFIWINEMTTVAAAWSLQQFMTDISHVGTSSTNVTGLQNAFAAVDKLVNTATGAPSGPALPAGAILPVAEMNTLADILAACINSTGGTSGDSSPCGNLFLRTSPSHEDTVAAALSIAQHPGRNVAALYALTPPSAPFQTTLASAPNDWTIAVNYNYASDGLGSMTSLAVDANGNVWIPSPSNKVFKLGNSGAIASTYSGGSLNVPYGIAIDTSGNAWVTNSGGNSLTQISGSTLTNFTGGGLNVPQNIAFDTNGTMWIVNSGNNSLSAFQSDGTALGTGYSGGGLNSPGYIAVNPH